MNDFQVRITADVPNNLDVWNNQRRTLFSNNAAGFDIYDADSGVLLLSHVGTADYESWEPPSDCKRIHIVEHGSNSGPQTEDDAT